MSPERTLAMLLLPTFALLALTAMLGTVVVKWHLDNVRSHVKEPGLGVAYAILAVMACSAWQLTRFLILSQVN